MERIKIGVKPVGKPVHVEWVTDDLKSFQNIVGGNIESYTVSEDLAILCDEEGKIKDKPYNCTMCGQDFHGDICFVGIDGENFTDCAHINLLKILLGEV